MSASTMLPSGLAAGLTDPFVPASIRAQGLEPVRRARLIVGLSFAGAGLLVVSSAISPPGGAALVVPLLAAAFLFTLPIVLRLTGGLGLVANLLVAALAAVVGFGNFSRVQVGQPPMMATAFVPLVAVLVGGWRVGLVWGGLSVLEVSFLSAVQAGRAQLPAFLVLPDTVAPGTTWSRGAGELAVILVLALVYDALKTRSLRELAETRDRAEQADRAKSAFVASLSHEVRTPISVIIGMSDMLLDGDLDADQEELVRTLRRSGASLLALVNDVLDLSKIEAGRLEIESIPFDPVAVAQDVRRQLEASADAKGIVLDLKVAPDVPCVYGDPGRVRQVLLNLVSNAVKFTSDGGVEISVAAEPHLGERTSLEFVVTDTGVGIPAEELPRLFERFTQISASTARLSGGSGLGLPICRELVERMDGRLRVRSQPGHGSRFAFSLSVRPADGPVTRALSRSEENGARTADPHADLVGGALLPAKTSAHAS